MPHSSRAVRIPVLSGHAYWADEPGVAGPPYEYFDIAAKSGALGGPEVGDAGLDSLGNIKKVG